MQLKNFSNKIFAADNRHYFLPTVYQICTKFSRTKTNGTGRKPKKQTKKALGKITQSLEFTGGEGGIRTLETFLPT